MPARTVSAHSFAKLNVFLEVLARRPDGFHELETVMLKVQLCDRLEFTADSSGDISLQIEDQVQTHPAAEIPTDERNLVVRIARALQDRTGCRQGCRILLEKHIPPQAGLGGGSSNAATALRCLNQLWNLRLPESALHEIAAAHGSDINFLLSGARAAVCRGRGEQIATVPVGRQQYFVATRPATGNATGAVFRRVSLSNPPESAERTLAWLASEAAVEPYCFNRLTGPARVLNPEMDQLMDTLHSRTGRVIQMSGSGSTLFLTATDAADAERLADTIRSTVAGPVWILEC